MVTVATALDELYPVDLTQNIELRGFINGNYGSYERDWFKASSGNIAPGYGVFLAAGASGEDTCTEWGAAANDGYGVAGWDRAQLALQTTKHTTADLVPVFGNAENPGMYFQGYCVDTNGNWDANLYLHAGAGGGFLTGDLATKIYANNLYYVADTAAAAQLIVMKVAAGGQGG